MMPDRRELPATPAAWFAEIREAYADAMETIPFGPLVGQKIGKKDLFHLVPAVVMKFRSLPMSGASLKRATDAALSSYVANLDTEGTTLGDPRLAFAFCYLASHYGLDLVDKSTVEDAMGYVERHVQNMG